MVKSDFVGGSLQTFGAGAADDFHATIGSITIGESYSGSISSGGDMGIVRIGGDVVGGAGGSSGRIFSGGKLAAVAIGGNLVGGAGDESGTVESTGGLGPVKIGGDMRGGAGAASGSLYGHAALAGVTLGGSLVGGTGPSVLAGGYILPNGSILSEGALGSVKIARDVRSGAGDAGSDVQAVRIGSISVGGSFAAGPVSYPVIIAYG
jgi:hypothetical protein